jgi:formate hydrogenlyase subunit 3/multisubunit Na+/H+ antiporter MnhD subunit
MREQHLTPFWGSLAFLLVLIGFGAKAGLLPLHAWLPEAHPAAPSPVSALLSAVMLKTALYGLLRVLFDLLAEPLWWWAVLMLGGGLLTALFGVVFAAVQVDMKRLLAYSSIENVGLLFAGSGLALLFYTYGMLPMAALALTAVLYHALSHAFFKSLLFVATGSVLHATGERNLGRLGGLIRYMPRVAWLALLGALASAGLPPLGGFVAEWLLLQSFLFTPDLPDSFLNMLIPVAAALVALVAALAGYTMVKFFGIIFLGQPREERLASAHDASNWECAGMLWLTAGCVLLGLLPIQLIGLFDAVTVSLVDAGIGATVAAHDWLLVPVALERASYGPLIVLGGVTACSVLVWLLVRARYHGRLQRVPPWDCGHPWQGARMQDTAEGFGQPIRQIFEPFFRMVRELPSPFDRTPHYRVTVEDPLWRWFYVPFVVVVERVARIIGLLQQGRIAVYLLYSFVTLVAMLLVVTE